MQRLFCPDFGLEARRAVFELLPLANALATHHHTPPAHINMSDIAKDVEKQLAVTEKEIVTGELDTTDNASRYLGYLGRIRPIFIASSRYLAYTSDVGESVRPVVNPKVVTGA